MRILITGSEGVLGSTLKTELRKRGHMVYGADLQHTSDDLVMRTDIAEYRQVDRLFEWSRPDMVYNFAAEFGRMNGQDYYEQLWKTNCLGTRNMIGACIKHEVKLIHASSSEAYGMADSYAPNRSLREEDLDEHPPQFHNEYALTKYTNERQITMAARNEKLDAMILRFFNIYGPPEKYNKYRSVICLFAYRLLAGLPITVYKNSFRTHLWIGDWCNTVANIAEPFADCINFNRNWPGNGGTDWVPVFNIGGVGKESTYDTLLELQSITGKLDSSNITVRETEASNVSSKEPDNEMAEVWLKHNPIKKLQEGLFETVDYLRKIYGF